MHSATILIVGCPPDRYREVSEPWVQEMGRGFELFCIAVDGAEEAVHALRINKKVDIVYFGNMTNRDPQQLVFEAGVIAEAIRERQKPYPTVVFEHFHPHNPRAPEIRRLVGKVFVAYWVHISFYSVPGCLRVLIKQQAKQEDRGA